MIAPFATVGRDWLALREPADAAARSGELAEHLCRAHPATDGWLIHDLGCGTGAMGRWLARRLSGPQHWILHDLDEELLAGAADGTDLRSRDGSPVTLEARRSDITQLEPRDFAGATLITASALLDMLTAAELARLIAACANASCPILLTLSVVGHVELTPADPLDHRVAAAFNAHQRRVTGRGRLLGPDAALAAVEQLAQLGRELLVRSTPWRLGPQQSELTTEWLTGWIDAACEQEAGLIGPTELYSRRRRAQAAAGGLRVQVHHVDLLAY